MTLPGNHANKLLNTEHTGLCQDPSTTGTLSYFPIIIINEDFDAVYKVVLYGIIENVYTLVHNGKDVAINTSYITTMGYYVVKFLLEPYTLQDNNKFEKKVIKTGENMVKVRYLCINKSNTNWY